MKGLDYDQLFPGRFIKAGDLAGRDVTVTISAIDLEDLPQEKGGDKAKGIISFAKTKKKLVLNRTNGECIKAMFGRDTGEWIGKRITLYPADFNGDLCIRIKGSPDIDAPVTFELKLPRKKPQPKTMLKTGGGANGAAKPPQNIVEAAEALGGEIGGVEQADEKIEF